MSVVQSSEDSMSFVRRLKRSTWNNWYMLMIHQILQSGMNYQVVRCFPDFPGTSYEDFFDRPGIDGFTILPSGVFWWWSTFALGIWSSASRMFAPLSHIFPVDSFASSGMANYMWEILT